MTAFAFAVAPIAPSELGGEFRHGQRQFRPGSDQQPVEPDASSGRTNVFPAARLASRRRKPDLRSQRRPDSGDRGSRRYSGRLSQAETVDAAPIVRDNRTFLPIRLLEPLGLKLAWEPAEQKATVEREGVGRVE